jgi:excisionase family DNA binding protein
MSGTFTVAEVAEILEVSKSTVYSLVKSGEIPSKKVRGRIQITEDDIQHYLTAQRHQFILDAVTKAFRDQFGFDWYEKPD